MDGMNIILKYSEIMNRMNKNGDVTFREFMDLHGFIGSTFAEFESKGITPPQQVREAYDKVMTSAESIIMTEFLNAFCEQFDEIMNKENNVPILMIQMNKKLEVLKEI